MLNVRSPTDSTRRLSGGSAGRKGHQISQEGVPYVLRCGRGSAETGQMTQRSRSECSCLTRKQTAGELGVCSKS